MAFKIFMEDFHRNTVLGKAKVVVQIQGPSYWKMFFWTITGTHLGSECRKIYSLKRYYNSDMEMLVQGVVQTVPWTCLFGTRRFKMP